MPNRDIPGQGKSALLVGFDLCYTLDDIHALYRAFCKMDPYGRALVAKNVFATSFSFNNPDVARFIAKPFDTFDNNFIDFEEFILACWNMLALRKEKLGTFAFNLLDVSSLSSLTREEAKLLISTLMPVDHDDVFAELEKVLENSHVSIEGFSSLIEQFPNLVSPLDDIYFKLREATLGSKRWDELVHARAMKFEGKSLKTIIREMKIKPSCITRLPVLRSRVESSSNADLPKRGKTIRGSLDNADPSSSRRKAQTARLSFDSTPSVKAYPAASAVAANGAGGGGGRPSLGGRKPSVVTMFTKSLSARLRLKLKIAQVQGGGHHGGRVLSSTEDLDSGRMTHSEHKLPDESEFSVPGFNQHDTRRRLRSTYDGPPRSTGNQNRADRRAKRATIG